MNKSTKNTYDYTINDYNNYINNNIFDYNGEYEFTKNNKFIKIIAYTNSSDILTLSHSTQPDDNYIIYSDTYNINNTTKTFLIDIKSNFFKINIQSNDLDANRIYNTYLESSDLNTRLYTGNGTEVNSDLDGNIITKTILFDSSGNNILADNSGNLITKSLLFDSSGNNILADNSGNLQIVLNSDSIIKSYLYDYNGIGIESTNNSINVYHTNNLSQSIDSVKSYLYDSNGNDINADNNGNLYITSTKIDEIYNILNTRGTETLYYNSNLENSNIIDFSNKKITSITVYGICSEPTSLTLQCSNNRTTWYSSQYVITMASGTSFGFALNGFCPKYFRLHNQNFATNIVTAYIDYC